MFSTLRTSIPSVSFWNEFHAGHYRLNTPNNIAQSTCIATLPPESTLSSWWKDSLTTTLSLGM